MNVRRYVYRCGGFLHWVFVWQASEHEEAHRFARWALNNWPQRGVVQA